MTKSSNNGNYNGSIEEKRSVLASLRYGSNVALCYASYETINDRKFMLKAIEIDEIAFECISEELEKDKSFIIEAIKANSEVVELIDQSLLDDQEFVYQAIKESGLDFKHVQEKFRKEKRFAIALVENDPYNYERLDHELKNDIDIIKKVVPTHHQILNDIDLIHKKDISLYLEALKNDLKIDSFKCKQIYESIPNELLTRENIIQLVSIRGCVFNYLPKNYKNDKEIIEKAIKNDGSIYKNLPLTFRDNGDLVLLAIQTCWHITKYVPKPYFNDSDIIEVLMKYNNEFFEKATKEVKNNVKVARKYVEMYHRGLCYVGEELRNNKDFVLFSIRERRNNFFCVDQLMQNDIDVIKEAVKQRVYFKDIIDCLDESTLNNPVTFKELIQYDNRFCKYLSESIKNNVEIKDLCVETSNHTKKTSVLPVEVSVEFPDLFLEYNYNCDLPGIQVGDQVRVSGKLSEETGIVTAIIGEKNNASHMQNIVKILSKSNQEVTNSEDLTGFEVTVEFPDLYLEYNYNCSHSNIKIGDRVKVSGKLSDEIGIVSAIIGKRSNAAYMKEVIQILPHHDQKEPDNISHMDLDNTTEFNLGDMTELKNDDAVKAITLNLSFSMKKENCDENHVFRIELDSGEGIEGEYFANCYHILCHQAIVASFVIHELSNESSIHNFEILRYSVNNNHASIEAKYHFTDIGYSE